jgi:hypothetical protein
VDRPQGAVLQPGADDARKQRPAGLLAPVGEAVEIGFRLLDLRLNEQPRHPLLGDGIAEVDTGNVRCSHEQVRLAAVDGNRGERQHSHQHAELEADEQGTGPDGEHGWYVAAALAPEGEQGIGDRHDFPRCLNHAEHDCRILLRQLILVSARERPETRSGLGSGRCPGGLQ